MTFAQQKRLLLSGKDLIAALLSSLKNIPNVSKPITLEEW